MNLNMRKLYRYLLLALVCCLTATAVAQTTKWREMYKVKKKDTIYGIAKKYDLTEDELKAANPEMKVEGYALKKGDYIFIPFAKAKATAQPATTTPTKQAAAARQQVVRVGIMLPLHNVDGDGRRMTEYYRGFLMAVDSLKRAGISTDIHAWNVTNDDDIARFTSDPAAAKCDIIFGPLYTHQVRTLAEFCKARDIQMVIPFSINGDDVARYRQIWQVWQSPDRLNNDAIEAYLKRFPKAHPVFIDCNDTASRKGIFTFGLRNRLENQNIAYSITNLNNSEGMFAKAFRMGQQNVVVLNSGRSAALSVALAKLQSLKNLNPSLQITLFGYTEWLMFTAGNTEAFHRFDTYIPSTFYYNDQSWATRRLEQSYRRWFHADLMTDYNPRFALTGYDHAMFFIRGLAQYGKAFTGTRAQSQYRPVQTPLRFRVVGTAGRQNDFFQLIHYTTDGRIEAVAY